MQPLMAYGGNSLLNLVIDKVYTGQRKQFKGKGSYQGVGYTYDIIQVPLGSLLLGQPNRNIKFDLVFR